MTLPQLTEAEKIATRLIQAAGARVEMPLILAAVTREFPHLSVEEQAEAAEQVAHAIRRAQITASFTSCEVRDAATGQLVYPGRGPDRASGCCNAPVLVEFITGARSCKECGFVLERPALVDEHGAAAAQPA